MIQFRLNKTHAVHFSVNLVDYDNEQENITDSNKLVIETLELSVGVPEGDSKKFAITFQLNAFNNQARKIQTEVEFWAYFEAEQDLTKEFLESHFTSVNAPAIAFPYLRSFLTNILVSAGYPALYLPTINFSATAKAEREASE